MQFFSILKFCRLILIDKFILPQLAPPPIKPWLQPCCKLLHALNYLVFRTEFAKFVSQSFQLIATSIFINHRMCVLCVRVYV